MKTILARSSVLAALVLGINAFALVGVAQNRAGESESTVTLTQDELQVRSGLREDSSMRLWINWHSEEVEELEKEMLGVAALEALGFDCSVPFDADDARRHYHWQPARSIYLVLEYDGEAWRQFKATKEEEGEFADCNKSRLFAVDLGTDPGELRHRHPDRSRYLIVRSSVRAEVFTDRDEESGKWLPERVCGRLRYSLMIPTIRVPASLRAPLEQDGDSGEDAKYLVTLSHGHRFEPWLEATEAVSEIPPSQNETF